MKIYTEEEVMKLMLSMKTYIESHNLIFQVQLEQLNPIELPSDEEIETEASDFGKKYRATTYEKSAYVIGAKYVINKIQGGNK